MRIHHPHQHDTCTFEETAAQSGGARSVLRIDLAPGGGNTLHRHRTYDEHFAVLEGRLGVTIGRDERVLRPGEEAFVPRGTAHRFFAVDDAGCTFRVTLTPGHTGFEQSLCILYGLATDGATDPASGLPRRPDHLAVVVALAEAEPAGPVRLAVPALRLLARLARWRGVERALVARYAADLPT